MTKMAVATVGFRVLGSSCQGARTPRQGRPLLGGWVSGRMGFWADGFLGGWVSGQMGFWVDGFLGGWVSGAVTLAMRGHYLGAGALSQPLRLRGLGPALPI